MGGARRMLGKGNQGGGFLFIQQEIGGLVGGWSHLKTDSAYAGDCVNIGNSPNETDFGFAASNIVDLAAVDAAFGSNQNVNTWYDQIGSNNLISGASPSQYVKTINEFSEFDGSTGIINTSTSGSLDSLSGAATFVTVCKHTAATFKANEFLISGGLKNRLRFYYVSGSRFLFRIGSSPRLDCDNVAVTFDNNIHLIVRTYDGSEDANGMNVYEDDMTTALSASKSETGTYTNQEYFPSASGGIRVGYGGSTNEDYQGLIYETLVFNKELSLAERTALKTILQQNPEYVF